MPKRAKNQPPPDHDENRLKRHAGAVEWMPILGTWDEKRGGIVPLSDAERKSIREARGRRRTRNARGGCGTASWEIARTESDPGTAGPDPYRFCRRDVRDR